MRRCYPVLSAMLFLGACASHQQLQDESTAPGGQQEINNELPKRDESVLVDQDMGAVTMQEKNDHETLRNLEGELRSPASTDESPASLNSDDQESSQSAHKLQKYLIKALSKDELTQQLFDAESISVAKGDTLSLLAKRYMGTIYGWPRIASLNPDIHNPDRLEIGQKLYVPKREFAQPQASASSANKIVPLPAQVREVRKIASEGAARKFETEAAPSAAVGANDNIVPMATLGSSHDLSDLRKEMLALMHLKYKQGQEKDEIQAPPTRKPAFEENPAADANPQDKIIRSAHKNLSKIVAIIGVLLMCGVFLSFLLSKPQKP